MESAFIGADVGDLRRLAKAMEDGGTQFLAVPASVNKQLDRCAWEGVDARSFRSSELAKLSGASRDASRILTSMARMLRTNAGAQEGVSVADGGGSGTDQGTQDTVNLKPADEMLDSISKLLSGLGLGGDGVKLILAMLHNSKDAKALETLLKSADGLHLKDAMKVLGGVSAFVDFAKDYLEHPNLSGDERLVHAIAKAGLAFGASAGIGKASEAIGAAIGTVALPGVGTVGGGVVGAAVGFAMSAAFTVADDQLHITDTGADAILEAYRFAKEHHFSIGEMTWALAAKGGHAVIGGVEETGEWLLGQAGQYVDDHLPWN